ncbi:ATP-binding cassette domain-containing protein [Clostridium aceticum]|nr:ATP-binding cassette domain-containing protein [Clostridium aceticum]KJF26958.1 ABC transporter [Clostridium aceticum]
MQNIDMLKVMKINHILHQYPYAKDFFYTMGLPVENKQYTIGQYIENIDPILIEDIGVDRKELEQQFYIFMNHMQKIKQGMQLDIQSITILGGKDKAANTEELALQMKPGEIICIVGPTGSGKSRLLADIEWMAQRDTPTQRQVLINGQVPPTEWRFSAEHKLVAQLSQNMNFVMDLNVYDFIKLHAESRMVDNIEEKVSDIICHANRLAGESFHKDTSITSLSGGQSRALMIADTAFLSISPIVLIDEIENAGIDRKKALNLLVKKDKIILMATHDPILALMGDRRIVIKNGGIQKVIETSEVEKSNLKKLEEIDKTLLNYREMLRKGYILNMSI